MYVRCMKNLCFICMLNIDHKTHFLNKILWHYYCCSFCRGVWRVFEFNSQILSQILHISALTLTFNPQVLHRILINPNETVISKLIKRKAHPDKAFWNILPKFVSGLGLWIEEALMKASKYQSFFNETV